MAAIRIGVNALYLIPGGVGGTEIYLRNLLLALAAIDHQNEYFVYTNRETGADLVPAADNFHHAPQAVRAVSRPARLLWEQLRLPKQARRDRLDVLFNPGFTSPARCCCPSLTVFHDLQHKRYPEHFRWFDLPFWNFFLWQSARTSRAIITVSQATADDMARFYPAASGKITVVHHGVDGRLFELRKGREQPGSERPFLLCVSTLHPHKNLERLIRVFARFGTEHPEFDLVVAGMRGFHTSMIERLIAELGLRETVRLTGWLPREQLYELYSKAHSCVYPSTFEGFGMPVLEALAAGVPTACSSIAPLREVAADAALYFDPLEETSMLAVMNRLAGDEELRKDLRAKGTLRATHFSWEEAARQTLSVFGKIVDQ